VAINLACCSRRRLLLLLSLLLPRGPLRLGCPAPLSPGGRFKVCQLNMQQLR
jgi:hypothetical protein